MEQRPASARVVTIPFADLEVTNSHLPQSTHAARWQLGVAISAAFGQSLLHFCGFDGARAGAQDRGKDLSGKIGDGFGRQGLGIVAIADVSTSTSTTAFGAGA